MNTQFGLFDNARPMVAKQRPTSPAAAASRAEAAAAIAGVAEGLRRDVLAAIVAAGGEGLTDEQIADRLGAKLDTARARRCELRDAGLVRDSKHRRATASGRDAVCWVSIDAPAATVDRPAAESVGRGIAGPAAPRARPAESTRRPSGISGEMSMAGEGRGDTGGVALGDTAQAVQRRKEGRCGWCGGRRFWRSVRWPDVVRCGDCHPPAAGIAVEWIESPPTARPGEESLAAHRLGDGILAGPDGGA